MGEVSVERLIVSGNKCFLFTYKAEVITGVQLTLIEWKATIYYAVKRF